MKKLTALFTSFIVTFLTFSHKVAYAKAVYVDTTPIDSLGDTIYRIAVKGSITVFGLIIVWCGYNLYFNSSSQKRTLAKEIGLMSFLATGFIVGSPWLAKWGVKIWEGIFAGHI